MNEVLEDHVGERATVCNPTGKADKETGCVCGKPIPVFAFKTGYVTVEL